MLQEEDGIELLRQFPDIDAAFAYGSGVIAQDGYNYTPNIDATNLPMVDLIFVVDNSEEWHSKNLILNPNHYTTPIPMTSKLIAYFQDHTGASIWYNVMIPMNIKRYPRRLMKYGVISRQKFLEDLLDWKHLYVAGRLQKPVQILKSYPMIDHAIQRNRENAIRTSLLLLPPRFNEPELFLSIAGLSYIGDPRMSVGENPKKVSNLVTSAISSYRSIYASSMDFVSKTVKIDKLSLTVPKSFDPIAKDAFVFEMRTIFHQDVSNSSRWQLCESLPSTMKNLLLIRSRSKYLRQTPPKRTAIRAALASIVARSATTQSIKGLVSAGFMKCSVYIFNKVSKRFSFSKLPVPTY